MTTEHSDEQKFRAYGMLLQMRCLKDGHRLSSEQVKRALELGEWTTVLNELESET